MPPTPTVEVPRVNPGVHKGPMSPTGPGALSGLETFRVDPMQIGAAHTQPAQDQPAKLGQPPKIKISDKTYGRAEPPPPMGDYDKVPEEAEEQPGKEPMPEHLKKQAEKEDNSSPADLDSSLDDLFASKSEEGKEGEESDDTPSADPSPETPPQSEEETEAEINQMAPKPLRKAFLASKKREAKLAQESAARESRIKELEQTIASLQNGAEVPEAHKARLAEMEKAIADREERIRVLDYTQSGEFKSKYQEPLQKAWESAYADLEKMEITSEDGTTRKPTEADLKNLIGIDNPARAGELAEQMFGKYGAQEAMQHRRNIRQLHQARQEAMTNAAAESKALLERRQKETVLQQQQAVSRFGKEKQSILTGQYKDLLGERAGDDEGNTLLRNYLTKFEKMVVEGGGDPETQIKGLAEITVMAAAYPRALRDLKKAQTEVANLQKQLKGFSKSEPKGGERSSNGQFKAAKSPLDQMMADIDAMPGRRG